MNNSAISDLVRSLELDLNHIGWDSRFRVYEINGGDDPYLTLRVNSPTPTEALLYLATFNPTQVLGVVCAAEMVAPKPLSEIHKDAPEIYKRLMGGIEYSPIVDGLWFVACAIAPVELFPPEITQRIRNVAAITKDDYQMSLTRFQNSNTVLEDRMDVETMCTIIAHQAIV